MKSKAALLFLAILVFSQAGAFVFAQPAPNDPSAAFEEGVNRAAGQTEPVRTPSIADIDRDLRNAPGQQVAPGSAAEQGLRQRAADFTNQLGSGEDGSECKFISLTGIDIPCGILKTINWLVDSLALIFIGPVEGLFTAVIDFNKDALDRGGILTSPGIAIGWSITRDVANLFFIILLIIAALATIFDLEAFNVKSVLPRLILIALLINFSLVIGTFVIKQANALGAVFHERAKGSTAVFGIQIRERSLTGAIQNFLSTKTFGAEREIRGAVQQVALNPNDTSSEKFRQVAESVKVQAANIEEATSETSMDAYTTREVGVAECGNNEPGEACNRWRTAVKETFYGQAMSPYIQMAISILAKIIIYPIAIFVFLAGAFLLLGRIITLAFLLVLAPLAFLSYLIPTQGGWWSKWWTSLFQQAFFFPAFMFCLMLSFLILGGIQASRMLASQLFLSYLLGIGFLLASIMVAQQMGMRGAATVTKYGGKLQGWAKTKAQNTGWRMGGWTAEKALQGPLGARLAGVPIVGAAIGRALQPAVAKKQKLAEEREKARVSRLGVAAGIGGDYAAGRWARASIDDQKEAADSLKPAQLRKLHEKVGAGKLRDFYNSKEMANDPKLREKFLSSIADKNKRAEVQTGVTMSGAAEFAAQSPDEQAKQTNAMAQVFSNMSDDDIRRMSADEVEKSPQMQAALELMGANTRFVNNFGNEIEKVVLLQDILIKKAKREGGLDQSVTAENLQEVAKRDLAVQEGGVELISSDDAREMIKKWQAEPTLDRAGRVGKIADELAFKAPASFTVKSIDDSYTAGPERREAYRRYYEDQARQMLRKSQATNMDFLQDSLAKTNAQGFHDTFTRNMNIRNSFMRGAAFSAKSGPPPAPAEGAPPAPATT